MTIFEIWEKYKHLDYELSDKEWLCLNDQDTSERQLKNILFDCWQAIKENRLNRGD